MRPTTVVPFSSASSSSSHTMARLALSRDRTVSPKPFSSESSATLTSSPMPTSISPASLRNCSMGTMPSDFRPALMTTTSLRTSTTTPLTMAPGLSLARLAAWLASNSSAKDSVAAEFMKGLGWIHGPTGTASAHLAGWPRARGARPCVVGWNPPAAAGGGWPAAGAARPRVSRAPRRSPPPGPGRPRPRSATRWYRCGRRRRPAAAAPPRGWHRGRRGRESPVADHPM